MSDVETLALGLSRGLAATPSNLSRVAKATTEEAARWAFSQWALRERARGKFRLAEAMLFVREALEQASHERVAVYHASRFPEGVLVADLTCGIGADLIGLARRGPAVGFELEEERAACARHNLDVHGLEASVILGDSMAASWGWDCAFADPARRVEGRRTLDPSQFSPEPREIARRMASLRLGLIKLSPLLPDPFLESLGGGLEFVSFDGECREALAYCGREAPSGRFAVQVEAFERLPAGEPPPRTEEPGAFLFEADPAAIRAHALGTLAARHGLLALGDSNGYLTGHEAAPGPWLKGYRVLGFGRADLKATRAMIGRLGVGVGAVKSRAPGVEPEHVLRQLRADRGGRAVVAVYPVGRSLRHVVAEPV